MAAWPFCFRGWDAPPSDGTGFAGPLPDVASLRLAYTSLSRPHHVPAFDEVVIEPLTPAGKKPPLLTGCAFR